MNIFEDLEQRKLVKQITNRDKIRNLLNNEKIVFYIGFDPTADSLHVGHLLGLVTAKRLVDAGHKVIPLIGGATATVGDPTGKSEMRKQLPLSFTRVNGERIGEQIKNIIPGCELTNNMAWFDGLSFLSMLRDIAPHFSVNNMLRADCFKSRMENGLSFLEFNYMIMQAVDFLKLNEEEGCMLQIGGDDQWSNILAGIDLIHKKRGKEVFGMTVPLLLNSDGTKMGKTEKGAVWLDKEKTSVFDFFQFWRNIPDSDLEKCTNQLSMLPVVSFNNPSSITLNRMKKELAFELTTLVHGKEEAQKALEQAEALFESRDFSSMEIVPVEDGIQLLDLLVRGGFARSRTDARNLINGRGIAINDQVIEDPTITINQASFGSEFLVRKGKKNFGRFIIKDTNEKTRLCDQRGS